MFTPGKASVRVEDLKSDTEYHYRAKASSLTGEAYGEDAVFTIQSLVAVAPSPAPMPSSAPKSKSVPKTTPPAKSSTKPTPPSPKSEKALSAASLNPTSISPTADSKQNIRFQSNAKASPVNDTQINSASRKIKLDIPKRAVDNETNVEVIERIPFDSTGMKILNLFDLNARDAQSGAAITRFSKDLQISINHDAKELTGLDLDSLRLYYLDETTKKWQPVKTSRFDKETRVLTATTDHFTHFGEMANPLITGPGRVMAAQVDMHSGAARFNYPLELPPGPGGFQPKLELVYNSASLDETKNRQATASWVGAGWSLDWGCISYDLFTRRYFLELNNGAYELITDDGEHYQTVPEQYFQIVRDRDSNTWEMKDREGTRYFFGGDTYHTSEQYIYDGDYPLYYRWDLTHILDINGNEANLCYAQDKGEDDLWVRSAYPEALTYNCSGEYDFVEVNFISSEADGQTIRTDIPRDSSVPAPRVMDTRAGCDRGLV